MKTIDRDQNAVAFNHDAITTERDRPLVSIIIRTHGHRGNLLRESLQSVIEQEYRPLEINVVEDGGHRAASVVNEFENLPDVAVNYLSIPPSGRCVAGNAGLAAATGQWINFLDDDDQLLPNHVRLLVEQILRDPALMGVFSGSLVVPTEFHSLDPLSYTERSRTRFTTSTFTKWNLWNEPPFPIQSCMFSRCLFKKYGGLDPELDCLEDWHLWMRYFSNERIGAIDDITSIFRMPANPEDLDARRRTHQVFLPIIAQKRSEIAVSMSGPELTRVATEHLRATLAPEIAAIADHPATTNWQIRVLLAAIHLARLVWRKARVVLVPPDPTVQKSLRTIADNITDQIITLSVADILLMMPELQSMNNLADYRVLQKVLRQFGRPD